MTYPTSNAGRAAARMAWNAQFGPVAFSPDSDCAGFEENYFWSATSKSGHEVFIAIHAEAADEQPLVTVDIRDAVTDEVLAEHGTLAISGGDANTVAEIALTFARTLAFV